MGSFDDKEEKEEDEGRLEENEGKREERVGTRMKGEVRERNIELQAPNGISDGDKRTASKHLLNGGGRQR